jgi:asparagine synthase (glutamine-hydrolysing)
MYAMAVWDEAKKNLFIARARMGIKPLYYYDDGTKIAFASEMKAILQDRRIPRELSREGIINYFTFGHAMAPHTIFRNIYKLPPGHYLNCRTDGEAGLKMTITRYWSPPAPQSAKDEGEQYYLEGIRRLLGKSVKRRLISDVPLGVFLSGGIDSSIITGLMSAVDSSQVKTFSIGFSIGDAAYNELDDARLVARHFGTDHHELLLDDRALIQILPDLIYHYDEPFGDSASFPTYLLSKFTRENVTVALSGEGGDEIFGGYRRYVVEISTTAIRSQRSPGQPCAKTAELGSARPAPPEKDDGRHGYPGRRRTLCQLADDVQRGDAPPSAPGRFPRRGAGVRSPGYLPASLHPERREHGGRAALYRPADMAAGYLPGKGG